MCFVPDISLQVPKTERISVSDEDIPKETVIRTTSSNPLSELIYSLADRHASLNRR